MKYNLSDEEIDILYEALEYRQQITPDNWWNDKEDKSGKRYTKIAAHLLERLNLDLTEK